jgi:dihydroorotate dehydrogenase
MYKLFIRPILFCFDPEKVHHFSFSIISWIHYIPGAAFIISAIYSKNNPRLKKEVFGISFPNPVGLAAGFDKEAKLYNQLSSFGFGFIEIGTVTPKAQPGNPKKRIFRLKKDQAIINRMGINNHGVEATVKNLKGKKQKIIIGGNIGKNTSTPNENALEDYLINFKALHPHVDYFVINVSCPNVNTFTKLQDRDFLIELVTQLNSYNNQQKVQKPILLKIAPDLNNEQLDEIIEIVKITHLAGVVATNTTTSRSNLTSNKSIIDEIGNGGLSGQPLKDKSTEVIRYLAQKSNKAFPIIGVGGIHSAEDALEKIEAGADLVQVYTGFIYEGPSLIKKINQKILSQSNK